MLIPPGALRSLSQSTRATLRDRNLWWLLIILLLAATLGLYGRFWGLGRWALGVDEFYITRSVDNLLRSGVPRFPCGGFYVRGLTYQYLVAGLRLSDISPELAGRLVSAASSLVGLPAAYLIGRRLGGRRLGLLLLIILLASVWEIEMARFARMYAPFQSIFLWYLVFFLRYTVDRDEAALAPMVALSLLGVLTWEGGALLGITNLLPPLLRHEHGRLQRSDAVYLSGMLLLLLGLLYIAGSLPFFRDVSAVPYRTDQAMGPAGWRLYRVHADWMVLFLLLPVPMAAASLPWIWSLRHRWLAAIGVCIALISALLHQFILCGSIFALLLLTNLVRPEELKQRGAARYCLVLLACAAFWLIFALATGSWRELQPPSENTHRWLGVAQHLAGFPNIFGEIIRPWGRTMPLLSVGAALLSGALIVKVVGTRSNENAVARVLLIVLLVVMLAVGARAPGRIETRYTFFIYPLVMALSLAGLLSLVVSSIGRTPTALTAAAVLGLLFFGLTEDFRPAHIAKIATWEVNFRVGLDPVLADHFYPRADYRLAAAWLRQHARPGDAVIIGIQSIDQYYHRADFFFLQDDDPRYDEDACRSGSVERWTNLPLLYRTTTLADQVATGQRIFLVLYPGQAKLMLTEGRRRNWRQRPAWVSPDHGISVTLINPS